MIKFANKSLPSYVKVLDVKYSILPTIDSKTEKVYGRAGVYDYGIELGARKIEVDIMIIADNQHDVMSKARDFATYLFYKELQSLILLDEPDKEYMARVKGDTDLQELYRTGQATIEFMCPSPYATSLNEKVINWSPVDYTPIQVTNNGSAETHAVIDMTLKEDSTSVAIITDENFVKVGNEELPDKPKVAIDPIVMNESMDTYTGWSTASQIDGGSITGALASNGSYLYQSSKDYGSGTGWHGGAGIKNLSRQLQDFMIQANINLSATKVNQTGRVEIYLLDINNVIIGKVALKDNATVGTFPKVEARVGALNGGHYFMSDYGNSKGYFANFNGLMEIVREGKQWSAYFGMTNDKGERIRIKKSWYDGGNIASTRKLAKIQVHIGTYGESEPVSTMYFSDLKVYEKSMNVDYVNQTPIIFKAGDVVTIDNAKAVVLKNGQPIFTELDPSSDFFSLERGVNGLIVSPPVVDVTIRYKERWL